MTRDEFVRAYQTMRIARVPRRRIAERLGLTPKALKSRYLRAVAAGILTPDSARYRRSCARDSARRAAGTRGAAGVGRCLSCDTLQRLTGRGLCQADYEHHRRAGTLDRYPRATRPTRDFAEDYAALRAQLYTRRQIADRLDMTPAAVQKAYSRAVAAGHLEPDSHAYRRHVFDITRAYQHTRWGTAA
jgi:DNA-binding Lrp family transcriptional regulator